MSRRIETKPRTRISPGKLPAEVVQKIKALAVERRTTITSLFVEALHLLLEKYARTQSTTLPRPAPEPVRDRPALTPPCPFTTDEW